MTVTVSQRESYQDPESEARLWEGDRNPELCKNLVMRFSSQRTNSQKNKIKKAVLSGWWLTLVWWKRWRPLIVCSMQQYHLETNWSMSCARLYMNDPFGRNIFPLRSCSSETSGLSLCTNRPDYWSDYDLDTKKGGNRVQSQQRGKNLKFTQHLREPHSL